MYTQVHTKPTSWRDATGPINFPMTNDLMFHLVLQKNEDILRGLISALLHIPIDEITSTHIENPIHLNDYLASKLFVFDVKVTINNARVLDLEMQVTNENNWTNRSLSYLCRNFDSLARGTDYNNVMPVIHIGILDFDLFPDHPEFYSTYKLTNQKNSLIYNDNFTMAVLSLNQISAATDEDRRWQIDSWAKVFKAKTWEELKMAATTTTLEKVADSIFVQNTDEQIRYAMFKKEEFEIHEAYMKRERERLQAESEAAKAENEAIKAETEAMKAENEAMKAETEAMKAETEAIKGKLGAAQAEIEELRRQLDEARK